jgi:hemoglobin
MKHVVKNDIGTEADVALMVNTFYTKVRADNMLMPIFASLIKDNWPVHLKKMVDFWSTLLLYTRKYKDDPMPKHMQLPVEQAHFDRWLFLFNQTIDDLFEGEIAGNARLRAASIAKIMMVIKTNQKAPNL